MSGIAKRKVGGVCEGEIDGAATARETYRLRACVWGLDAALHHGFPDIVHRESFLQPWDGEEGGVPPNHRRGLFKALYQVVKAMRETAVSPGVIRIKFG